jgi:GT2 family glycosyltransferase
MELISILICSRGRRSALEQLVLSLRDMETPCRTEVIVVEETDNPSPISDVHYIPHPIGNRGFPYARNLAVANASGNLLVFVDDDCIISNGWLNRLLKPFEDPSVVGVQGGVAVPDSSGAIGWAESVLGFPGGGIRRVCQAGSKIMETKEISTVNCAYRKWVFDKVGGFDESLLHGGEDYLFAKRACEHGRCVFVPDAMVFHHPRGNLVNIFLWLYRRGKAEFSLALSGWRVREFLFYWLRSSLLLKILLVFVLGSVVSATLTIFCTCLSIYYLVTFLKYHGCCKGYRVPFEAFVILPLVKMVMDLGIDCGRFRTLFLRN